MNDFDKALEVLREKGWCKRFLRDSYGHVCLVGALDAVDTAHEGVKPSDWHLLALVSHHLFPERGITPSHVNDHEDTTIEDIELILKHASYEWEQQHHG